MSNEKPCLHTPDDIADSVRKIWSILHEYQEEHIPHEKYRELSEDPYFGTSSRAIYAREADAYEEEWDDICFAMARITESLDLTQEEVS